VKQTLQEIVKEYIPDASDDFVEYIIGNKTGWPSFWHIPEDGNTPIECFRTQVFWFSWIIKRGMEICLGCGKPIKIRKSPNGHINDMCPKCKQNWNKRAQE